MPSIDTTVCGDYDRAPTSSTSDSWETATSSSIDSWGSGDTTVYGDDENSPTPNVAEIWPTQRSTSWDTISEDSEAPSFNSADNWGYKGPLPAPLDRDWVREVLTFEDVFHSAAVTSISAEELKKEPIERLTGLVLAEIAAREDELNTTELLAQYLRHVYRQLNLYHMEEFSIYPGERLIARIYGTEAYWNWEYEEEVDSDTEEEIEAEFVLEFQQLIWNFTDRLNLVEGALLINDPQLAMSILQNRDATRPHEPVNHILISSSYLKSSQRYALDVFEDMFATIPMMPIELPLVLQEIPPGVLRCESNAEHQRSRLDAYMAQVQAAHVTSRVQGMSLNERTQKAHKLFTAWSNRLEGEGYRDAMLPLPVLPSDLAYHRQIDPCDAMARMFTYLLVPLQLEKRSTGVVADK